MINGDARFRVYNRCLYDIGVTTLNNISFNIRAGSFQIMTANDIMFVDTNYSGHFFSNKMLVAVNDNGDEVPLTDFGLGGNTTEEHISEDEITQVLKGSVKKLEEWLSGINDQSELHAVYKVAQTLDLPINKIKLLSKYIPNKDWLDQLGEDK